LPRGFVGRNRIDAPFARFAFHLGELVSGLSSHGKAPNETTRTKDEG